MKTQRTLCRKSIVHCFTGSKETVYRYLQMGFYIGITGWICDNRRNKELLEEFFKYSTEFKHITTVSATAECHHISIFLDSLNSIPNDWSILTADI